MFATPADKLDLPGGEPASAITRNLTCTSTGARQQYICASGKQIFIVGHGSGTTQARKEFLRHRVRSIQAVQLAGPALVAITTDDGFSVWDADMRTCHFSQQVTGTPIDMREGFGCQCAAALVCADGCAVLCVGATDGCVRLYEPSKALAFVEVSRPVGLEAPVLALEALSTCAARPHRLLVSTGANAVHVFEAESASSGAWTERLPVDELVVAMAHNAAFVVLGLWDGRVHLLQQETLALAFEIVAHSRFLSALQMHSERALLLTAAQDGTAAVWALPQSASGDVEVASSLLWHNRMIAGACFAPAGAGKRLQLVTSAYSIGVLQLWDFDA